MGMINAETAEMVSRMAENCLEEKDIDGNQIVPRALVDLAPFRYLSSSTLFRLLDYGSKRDFSWARVAVLAHPLDILLKYFWDTIDERAVDPIAYKLMETSVTYQTAQGGKSMVSIKEKGKNIQQEVPNELVEKLLSSVKAYLHREYGDFHP